MAPQRVLQEENTEAVEEVVLSYYFLPLDELRQDLSWKMVVDGTRDTDKFTKEFYGEFSRLNMKLLRTQ